MNTLLRKIIVLITINLITAGFVPAQNATPEEQAEAARIKAQADRAEIEARQAKEQVDAERLQIEELKERIKELQKQTSGLGEIALPTPAPTPKIRIPSFTNGMFGSSGSVGSILVIPSEQMSTEDILAMNEDITVMSRIFRQQLDQETSIGFGYGSRGGMYFDFDPFASLHRGLAEAMYLEGYGALFLIKVDFPLSPPEQEVEQEEQTEQEDVDPVWEQTKRDIYEPQQVSERRRRASESEQQYDAEKVENLKATLIKALKHASNIRGLQQNESVILAIIGSGEPPHSHAVIVSQKVTVNGKKTNVIGTPTSVEAGIPSPMMLVIRAKKSDIDDFANDDINLEQFRERVQILECPYLSESTHQTSTSVVVPTSTGRSRSGRSDIRPGRGGQR
jgi:hypothetical protein